MNVASSKTKIVRSFTANRAVKLNLVVYGSSLPICGTVEVDSVFGDFLGLFHCVLAWPLTGKPVNRKRKIEPATLKVFFPSLSPLSLSFLS